MGDNRTHLSPAELAARLDRVAALLRDPAIRFAMEMLDEIEQADRLHGLAQSRRRMQAARMAAEAGHDLRSLEQIRRARKILPQQREGRRHG